MADVLEVSRLPLSEALIKRRKAYVTEWSGKTPGEIQTELERLRALVLERGGVADAYGLEPAWTIAALQQALDTAAAREFT